MKQLYLKLKKKIKNWYLRNSLRKLTKADLNSLTPTRLNEIIEAYEDLPLVERKKLTIETICKELQEGLFIVVERGEDLNINVYDLVNVYLYQMAVRDMEFSDAILLKQSQAVTPPFPEDSNVVPFPKNKKKPTTWN